jgi:hypothetical protein
MTYQSKWKSYETKTRYWLKPQLVSFSAMFFTATLLCATSHTVLFFSLAMRFITAAAMTVYR